LSNLIILGCAPATGQSVLDAPRRNAAGTRPLGSPALIVLGSESRSDLMAGTTNERFRRLVEPNLDALFRAAYRLSRHRADAEDLVQETCIRACQRINELDEELSVKSWLLRVLHNVFIDGARRARSAPIDRFASGTDLAAVTISSEPTPEESLHAAQREALLENAWRKLERGQRALLALRAEGYSLSEISTITGIAMDALTMRLYRARRNLTRCLKEVQAPPTEARWEAVQ
jgi:RNA polymerase sigma-70 factor (ECF subfamily)